MTTVLESLNNALHHALDSDPNVIFLGEDILDPYGGAFKVARGLSTAFPGRVLTTPISEASLVGLASGMALRGLRPVVEIMFGDFLTLAADQLINHAAKFRWMYNGGKLPGQQVRLPMVVRAPMGGRRGYGPTHSQTLEKHFLGVPGLHALAPCTLGDPGELLFRAILDTQDPLLFIENKLLYLLPVRDPASLDEFDLRQSNETYTEGLFSPCYNLSLREAPPASLTLATYGYMAELARQAALTLAYEHEVFIELVVPTRLSPFEVDPILDSVRRTGNLLTFEAGGLSMGWGAEIVARVAQALGSGLHTAHRLAAKDLPVPASGPLESAVLPGVDSLVETCLDIQQKG
jgi:pyruvate/2-oxoglutarate/acetoin dehydrogenase E1 component